jgi:hypothetical protein
LREAGLTCTNHARLIRRWGIQRSLVFHIRNAERTGRPSRLSPENVDECILALVEGQQTEEGAKPYESFAAFCRDSPIALEVLAGSKVTEKHLLRTMKAVLPTLQRIPIEIRVFLTAENKEARVQAAKAMLRKPQKYFKATIWADAKVLYAQPKSRKAWVDTAKFSEDDTVVEDKRLKKKQSDYIKLKFYLAVNSELGAVHLKFVTGTTGMKGDRQDPPYLVSGLSGSCQVAVGWVSSCLVLSRQG